MSSIVKNPHESMTLRVRALEALRHYPTHPFAESTITQVLGEPNQEAFFVRAALITLADVGNLKATPKIVPYLSSPDSAVREGAAVALTRTQDPSAGALLEKAALRENNNFVRNHMLNIVAEMKGRTGEDARKSTVDQGSDQEWKFIGPPQKLSPTAQ